MKKWLKNTPKYGISENIAFYANKGVTATVGDPKPTITVSFERMKELEMVGLYEEVEVRLENIRIEYVNDGFSLVFEFTGNTEAVWFYKGMSTKGVVNQLAGFVKKLFNDLF